MRKQGKINISENEILKILEKKATAYRRLIYSENNFYSEFGLEQSVNTPIGEAVIYEEQFDKIYRKKREHYFGLIKPTLQEPILIIEHKGKILFIKTFINKKNNVLYFVSVTKDDDGFFNVVSNHEKRVFQILNRIKDGDIRYISEKLSGHDSSLNAEPDVTEKHHSKYTSISFGFPLSFTKVQKKVKEILFGHSNTTYSTFLEAITFDLINHKKHNKTTVEKLAAAFGIVNKNIIKETTELAIVNIARSLSNQNNKSDYEKYLDVVELYKNQVNLSHRTSQSMLMQQYSTAAPISYIASLYVKSKNKEAHYFEPSAGNGLLTIALPPQNTIVNEIDDVRLSNLKTQNFERVTNQNALIPFTDYYKKFDGITTNPPFGTLLDTEIETYDGFKMKTLDHLMALRALDTMKDDGKAAIVIGGHTKWDDKGRTQSGKNRLFFNYLYSHYNVEDVILIDGHKLYSRQGTAFNTRLILIDGRKKQVEGFASLKNEELATVVSNFGDLWARGFGSKNEPNNYKLDKKNKRIRIAKAKAKAKLKLLEFKV